MRRQLPVHSPLGVAHLSAGLRATLLGGDDLERQTSGRLLEWYAARALLGTDSGTTALSIALASCAAADREERPLLLPAYGCFDLATAVVGAGVQVRLYDVDPWTLGPDLDQVRALLSAGAAGIVVAHVYGVPVDMPTIERLAAEHGTPVVEDAAQGVGGMLHGRRLGAFGDWGVLSFGRGKGMTGIRGGALLAHSQTGADAIARWRWDRPSRAGVGELVRGAGQYLLGRPLLYALPTLLPGVRLGETVYHAPSEHAPWSRATVAMLERSMDEADGATLQRRERAAALLADVPLSAQLGVGMPTGARPGYLRLPVLTRSAAHRATLLELGTRLGVAAGYPITLAELQQLTPAVAPTGTIPVGAGELASRLITLPTHGLVSARDLSRLRTEIIAKL